MRFLRFQTLAAATVVLAVTPVPGVSLAATAFDPFSVETRTSPAPNLPWIPVGPLPQVPAPEQMQRLPAELSRPVSLAELTEIALRLNVRTRQAWMQARVEAAQFGVDHSGVFPQVSGLIGYRTARPISGTSGLPNNTLIDSSGRPATAAAGGQPYTHLSQIGPTLNLSYILFDFGKRAEDKAATEYRILAANLAQNRALQEVAFQVEQAYYRVLGLEQLVGASKGSLKNFETALDASRRRRESGLATAADFYRAETQVGQAQLVLSRNEGELSKARGLLAGTVGLPVDFPLQLQGMTARPPVSAITQSMEELLTNAKVSRPDLVAAEARARAARATARAESKASLPSVELSGQFARQFYTDPATLVPQNAYSAGINLRIPIFSGFSETYRMRRREEEAKIAEAARDQLYTQTQQDVWQAYFDLQTAAAGIASSANLIKSAGQSADAAVARYGAGVGSLLDLITAQLDDTNAKVQEIQSHLDWYLALARLNFALGASDSTVRGSRKP